MEQPVLGDPDVYPTDAVLASHLGRAKAAFDALFDRNHSEHPDFEESWKYYNDGKSWLLKVSKKKKTLFWLSVGEGFFRATFYLGSKAEDAVLGSSLPDELKEQYRETSDKKFHGITLLVKAKKDLAAYDGLLEIKLASP